MSEDIDREESIDNDELQILAELIVVIVSRDEELRSELL